MSSWKKQSNRTVSFFFSQAGLLNQEKTRVKPQMIRGVNSSQSDFINQPH
jgi:hypothetical protein